MMHSRGRDLTRFVRERFEAFVGEHACALPVDFLTMNGRAHDPGNSMVIDQHYPALSLSDRSVPTSEPNSSLKAIGASVDDPFFDHDPRTSTDSNGNRLGISASPRTKAIAWNGDRPIDRAVTSR